MKRSELILITLAIGLICFGLFYSNRTTQNTEIASSSNVENQNGRTPSNTDEKNHPAGSKNRAVKDKASEKVYIEKFQALKKCLSAQDCDFPQTDPRSYELEVYKAINAHLNAVDVLPSNLKKRYFV